MRRTMNRNWNSPLVAAIIAALASVTGPGSTARAEPAYAVDWIRQFGSSGSDTARGVSADGLGNVYISGETGGILPGPNAGEGGAFVSKYDVAGALQWTRQSRTGDFDGSTGVSADALGNVYITGDFATRGPLGEFVDYSQVFVSKYDPSGDVQWTRQLGTSDDDFGTGVSADGLGNVYISGATYGSLGGPNADDNREPFEPYPSDAFVSKYDAAGGLQWIRQWGTRAEDAGLDISADGLGNVYTVGYTGTTGSRLGGDYDAFLNKYDASGALQWTRQWGNTGTDMGVGVSADALGNIYISGFTEGSLGGPNENEFYAFVNKYDAAGALQWTRQGPHLRTDYAYFAVDVSADGLANLYLTGFTASAVGGDAFVSKYDASGALLWSRQLGTSDNDYSHAVSADRLGNVYIAGGALGGPTAEDDEVFLARLTPVPEPSSLALLALAVPLIERRRRRGSNRPSDFQVLR